MKKCAILVNEKTNKTFAQGVNGQMAQAKRTVVEYRIYELPLELPIVCLTGDAWRISDVPAERLHFHNCMEIGFCHSEDGYLDFETERTPFEAGDVFIIPRHVPHTTCSREGCKSRWSYLFVDLDALTSALLPSDEAYRLRQRTRISKPMKITRESDERLHFLCRCMLEEASREDEDARGMLQIYALAAASELQRRSTDASRHSAKNSKAFPLKPALEYIHDHYMEPCDASTLASLCHLSQTHFRRLFLSCMGSTPLQFVISTRIYQACVLLLNSDEPVLTIAQAVGMPSVSSFNRNFQQVMGMSPRQYRTSTARPSPMKGSILPYRGWTLPEG